MAETTYDIIIGGGGPIGAATAYFLAQQGGLKVAVITQEQDGEKVADHSDTYNWAGGSIRWYWPDPAKGEMPRATAEFVRELGAQGVDLGAIMNDSYLFVHRGLMTPAINLSGAKLVSYLLQEAAAKGVEVIRGHKLSGVAAAGEGYEVTTDQGSFQAGKVLLALGANNAKLMPAAEQELEKRQVYVLDLPVDENREHFPHTIVPVGEGVAYVFVKKTADGLKLYVGQEDVVHGSDEPHEDDNFQEMLDNGLGAIMPFLKEAKVTAMPWGYDVANASLQVTTEDNKLMAANCGSAVRSCIWIGRELTQRLTA